MGRRWLDPKFLLILFLLIAFSGLFYLRRSINEAEEVIELRTTFDKGHLFKRSSSDLLEQDVIIQRIKILVKQYQADREPDLLPELPPLDVLYKKEEPWPWDVPVKTTVSSTILLKKRPRKIYKKNEKVKMKESSSTPGFLNIHYWDSFCGSRIEDLKRNIHFPFYPSESGNLTKFFIQRYETGFGQRIFGYIHPPETGNFTFAVSCDDNCEVWLSSSESPNDITKIANVGTFQEPANTKIADFQAFPSQISKQIHLQAGEKYFIEVLHKQGAYKDHVLLAWLAPSWEHIKTIKDNDISSFIDVQSSILDVNDYKYLIPLTKATAGIDMKDSKNSVYFFDSTKHTFTSTDYREEFFLLPSVDAKDFVNILPGIKYHPSYLLNFAPRRYEGVTLMHESAIHPSDYTELTHMLSYEACDYPRNTDSHYYYTLDDDNDNDVEEVEDESIFHKLKTNELPPSVTVSFPDPKIRHTGDKSSKKSRKIKRKTTSKLKKLKKKKNRPSFKASVKSRKLMALNEPYEPSDDYMNKMKNPIKPDKPAMIDTGNTILNKIKGARKLSSQNIEHIAKPKGFLSERKPLQTGSRRYSRYGSRPRYQSRRHRKERIVVYKNKVSFKDGKLQNFNLSSTVNDKAALLHYYPLFGTATYYLVQQPARHSLWKYKMFLSKCRTDGNLPLNSEVAVDLIKKYMHFVKKKHGSKYKLKRIVNVEENHDVEKGDRYLIEIELEVKGESTPRRLSKYIYRETRRNKLFEPIAFEWDAKATVHVIVPVKNQGRWVQHLIDNLEKVYEKTEDAKLNVIIVDFNSTDIDIQKSLTNSKLKRYNLIQLDGAFQRALGIQAGADLVQSEDDILFTCDLHLDIPAILIDTIRKHTIKKKLGFAPMVHRLSCGYTPDLPYGLWETEGYGLFSITKYDFDRIGGMNTEEFKTKWGGEDWEFLDRALGHGLEVERLRVPNFFHHYHSKKKMWVAPTKPVLLDKNTTQPGYTTTTAFPFPE